jgi:hypothetical protein
MILELMKYLTENYTKHNPSDMKPSKVSDHVHDENMQKYRQLLPCHISVIHVKNERLRKGGFRPEGIFTYRGFKLKRIRRNDFKNGFCYYYMYFIIT